MRKLIIALALVAGAAAATVGYIHYRSPAGQGLASAVPSDTLFYVGPAAAARWLDTLRRMGVEPSDQELAEAKDALAAYGPGGQMMYGLYAAYGKQPAGKEIIPGLGDSPRLTLYTIGLVPTMHLALTDPKAFTAFLDDAEKRGGVQAATGSYQGTSFRRYPFVVNGNATRASLVVAVRDKLGVVAISASDFRDDVLPLALGLKKPGTSVIPLRDQAAAAHGLEKDSISLVSYRAIVNAVTGGQENLASRMLDQVLGDSAAELAHLRTPACRKDFGSMADVSPLAVSGWVTNGGGGGPLHLKAISEIKDASLTHSLERLRGHIPAFLNRESTRGLLSLALAVNMSAPGPVISDLWQRFTSASFQCKALVEAQERARAQNPAAIAMATLMVSAVRGLSATVYGLEQDKGSSAPGKGADALVTISAEDPRSLVALAQGFVPGLANLKIPDDGSPVALPDSLSGGYPLMVSMTDKHIALFMGPEAAKAAATLKNESLDANGILFMAIDYHRLAPILLEEAQAMESAAAQAAGTQTLNEVRDSIKRMARVNMSVAETVDVKDEGIVLDATIKPGRD
ncbi:MAG: hypothetical protein WB783_14645 [Arenicellales bacterium]